MMHEEWRQIRDATNYEVSDEGRVRNKKTGRILKQQKISNTPIVNLMDAGFQLGRSVPKLVEEAFGHRPF